MYFTLPEMVRNLKINKYLMSLHQKKPEYFKFPITFFSVNGNFSFTLWNGELNNNFGDFFIYKNLNISQMYDIPVRFNCANTYLKNTDFYDEYMNIILQINEDENNYIEIADLELMDYIKEHYPKYHFILSNSMHLYNRFTPEFLNAISQFDAFDLIKIPANYPDLFKLNNKDKFEIIIDPLCSLNCEGYDKCYSMEQLNQINYSDLKVVRECKINNTEIKIEPTFLANNGFKYFSFMQSNNTLEFYVRFFIKEEFQEEVIKEYNND